MEGKEQALIERAARGESEAFEELYLAHSGRLYAIAWRFCGVAADSEDIVQECMIKAWRSIRSFRYGCEFSTWLYRICVNCAKDHLRKAKRNAHVSSDDLLEQGYEAADDGFEDSLARQNAVRAAMGALCARHREILLLRDAENFSYEEIAQILSLPIGTVRSRINRARAALKAEYLSHGTKSDKPKSNKHGGGEL